ncbi:MAG: N-acetyltransferase [Gallionella sp.]|nr:MAG: N-acetyltransferase [Gallionella sp.]
MRLPDMDSPITLPSFPDGYILATPRLSLRPPCSEDLEALWPHVSNPRLTAFLAWEPHQSRDETRSMISSLAASQQLGKSFHWIVRDSGGVVGLVSLIDVRRTHRSWIWNRAELAYWIGPGSQGLGYATEASEAVMRFGFESLGLHKIVVYHAADNPPSGRVVQKLGFRLVGDERDSFCKHGRWHDLRYYEMLCSNFEALHPSRHERQRNI